MQGIFITFEGIDGCGKSTHIDIFRRKLESIGRKVLIIREPGGTGISEKIRDILLDKDNSPMKRETELLLFEAARAQLVREKIIPALESGGVVVCDRFMDSSLAYQGFARGLGKEIVENLNSFATGGLVPDITYLLDISPEKAFLRISGRDSEKDRMDEQGLSFMKVVRGGYLQIAKENPERIKVLNAEKNIEELSCEIYEIFKEGK